MAFKMKGFSPFNKGKAYSNGAMDYSKSAMPKSESPLTVKAPKAFDGVERKDRKGSGDQKGQTWTKVGVDKKGNDEYGYMDNKSARQSERKTSRAENMQAKAEKLRGKQEGASEKKKARLQKRIDRKTARADKKLNQAANIQAGRKKNENAPTPKPKKNTGKPDTKAQIKATTEKAKTVKYSDAYKKRGDQYKNYTEDEFKAESKRQMDIYKKTGKWDYKNAPKK
jgi:hypothetical protein